MSEEVQEETRRETDQEEWDRKHQERLAEHEARRERVSSSEVTWMRPPKNRTGEVSEEQSQNEEPQSEESQPDVEPQSEEEAARQARRERQSRT